MYVKHGMHVYRAYGLGDSLQGWSVSGGVAALCA